MKTIHINKMVYGNRELHCEFASLHRQDVAPEIIQMQGYQFQLAHPTHFVEQIKWSTNLYLHGGETFLLLYILDQIPGWKEALEGKVICAYSAGVSALARYSYNGDHMVLVQGTGVLPFNTIVHYDNRKWWMADDMEKQFPDIPLVLVGDDDKFTMRLP